MNDKKREVTSEVLLADLMLRVIAMEKLLIDKQIVSKEDLSKCAEEIANKISQVLLDKVKAAKDTADLISSFGDKTNKN